MFDSLPPYEAAADLAEFEAIGKWLEAHDWVFAKTMPDNPHEYTLRKRWPDQATFDRTVLGIRRLGYQALFKNRAYTQLDVNDHYYWTMGAPVPATTLINRKQRQPDTHPALYDAAAARYDPLFARPEFARENRALFSRIGDLSTASVLDVGCGTGLLLDHVTPGRYLGIDPSSAMLARLQAKHPASDRVRTVYTTMAAFVGERYDAVLALFGAASYLTAAELQRLPSLLKPGGRAVLMFYAPGYHPVTHQALGLQPATILHAPADYPVVRFGNYDLAELVAP